MKDGDVLTGAFNVGESKLHGVLRLAGPASDLHLSGDAIAGFEGDLHGVLSDGRKISALQCVEMGQTHHGIKDVHVETHVFPHFVAVGPAHLGSKQPVIRALHYSFDGLDELITRAPFSTIYPEPADLAALLAKQKHAKGIKLGERPIVLYFGGSSDIIAVKTAGVEIKLRHRFSYGMGSAKGIGFDNTICATLAYDAPVPLREAIERLMTLHRFFELCLGSRRAYGKIEVECEADPLDQPSIELYWSYANERARADRDGTHAIDILLDPVRRAEEFAAVLAAYLESEAEWRDARDRFGTAFYAGGYSIDRIVGAANTFDILPKADAPAKVEPTGALLEAVTQAKALFKALPADDLDRQRILQALSLVGTPSLRRKIRHRADIIISTDPAKFADLYLPCDQAWLCRNHYVHGSEAGFDYGKELESLAFVTDTIEFVFGASDFIQRGWDWKAWREQGTTMSHPFGRLLANYDANLAHLKSLVAKASKAA